MKVPGKCGLRVAVAFMAHDEDAGPGGPVF